MTEAADGRFFYVQVDDEKEQFETLCLAVLPLNTE